ncbi:hypothetical protein BU24DRAFT_434347 [Aaosphaeria arxii CBS 175.79]|uniref:REJ domain-containing protein n=1 Tax=Aaosphaeria arxii CBS 175.79 TaxID=1450172 RepID=A0A6A5XLP7_9PLEO|nr:uncharacterized protein BU24DRAFT_434347 [Aaosphaeria arxii CBS 175.79]KAF2013234.1 hypothetical protein BU24DRAFT_434347 [Aaosphaeria arxii CBS 175.79]
MQQTSPNSTSRRQHSEESWIEIGSRPSSSSLSSANEEIITTGLRVQHDSNQHRRRRRTQAAGQFVVGTGYRATNTGGASSQEEYDESESESDRVMTSSTEGIGPSPLQNEVRRPSRSPYSVASSETMSEREDEDDDENATAVNYPRSTRRQFAPRPNAFSHPASVPAVREDSGTTYAPRRPSARPSSQRHSYPQHSPFNAVSPHYMPEHDEALRASLSTLLSAAAAVRGLPKPGQSRTATTNQSTRVDPTSLRLVPESVALGGGVTEEASSHRDSPCSSPSAPSPRTISSSPSDNPKRKASPPPPARSSSKDRRATKKVRKAGPMVEEISPTLLTWVVSAGVVVLVSALSFSAGYVVGKETGHAEAMGQLGAAGGEAGRCGKEAASGLGKAGMGLRRFRWSGGSGVRV